MRKTPLFTVILTLSLLAGICHVEAQIERSLRFMPENLDFGTIRETDGKVTGIVMAVNTSPDSTFIISARTSCGCSEAEFDGRMLAPGDTATVRITYDPTNRPGKFQKSAKIFTGRERISNMFRITGNVIPSRLHLDRSYPEKKDDLRLSTLLVEAGETTRSSTKPFFIGIYNDSDKNKTLRAESDDDALQVKLQPDTIEPFGITTLSIMLKGKNIPPGTTDFKYDVTITDPETGDTLVVIPIGGFIKET